MEFDCTKEGKNIYFACREKAAKYNDLLNSRERAAELLGISTSTLANHELGVTKNVPPDTVSDMATLCNYQEKHHIGDETPSQKKSRGIQCWTDRDGSGNCHIKILFGYAGSLRLQRVPKRTDRFSGS